LYPYCDFFVSVSLVKPISGKQKNIIRTVIIDAGHGGSDPGAKGLFSTEAEVSLSIALKLGKAFEKEFPNIRIVYTRTTDVLPYNSPNVPIANRRRAEHANQEKGDLFICIHCNSAGKKAGGWTARRVIGSRPKTVYVGKGKKRKKKVIQEPIYQSYYQKNEVHGTETYIWAADRSGFKSDVVPGEEDESGEMATDSLNILDLETPEAKIRAQLYTKYFFDNSYLLASLIQDEFTAAGRVNRGVQQRNNKGIWVLQATGMPSVLVETGFISNKEEEEYLNSNDGQSEIVGNIMSAFKSYKQQVEQTKKGSAQSNSK
jgi:N-acetylmuramoyl-L-alanine amidase